MSLSKFYLHRDHTICISVLGFPHFYETYLDILSYRVVVVIVQCFIEFNYVYTKFIYPFSIHSVWTIMNNAVMFLLEYVRLCAYTCTFIGIKLLMQRICRYLALNIRSFLKWFYKFKTPQWYLRDYIIPEIYNFKTSILNFK